LATPFFIIAECPDGTAGITNWSSRLAPVTGHGPTERSGEEAVEPAEPYEPQNVITIENSQSRYHSDTGIVGIAIRWYPVSWSASGRASAAVRLAVAIEVTKNSNNGTTRHISLSLFTSK
jgi:hypothetical protein